MSTYMYEKPKRTSEMALAGLGSRLVALIIDSMILAAIAGAGWFGTRNGLGGVAGFLVGVGYQWFFLTQNNGQTLGKMLMGIRVVKVNGERLTGWDAVLRYVGYYLNSAILMLGWIWALGDEDRQGWHDKLAGTIVVQAR